MRCIRYSHFGGPDVLEWCEVPLPEPGPGQVRLRVAGAGVNPIDYKTRSGLGFAAQALGASFAFVPGYDVSGVVDALGEGVDDRVFGEALYGMVNFPLPAGAYSEFVVAAVSDLAPAPTRVSLAQAAGLPLAGMTAWQALFDVGQLQAGERVLVLAGAGGVGHLATQLAAWKGAHVSATASAAKHDFLRQHGVQQPLDYRDPVALQQSGPWDLILDLMGGAVGVQALDWLADGGRLVTVPTNTAAQLLERGTAAGRRVLAIRVQPSADQLGELAKWVDAGQLRLHVSATLPLRDASHAHTLIEQGHVQGKLILVP